MPQAEGRSLPATPVQRPARKKPAVPEGQSALFEPVELPAPVAQAAPTADDWIGSLLGSPIYASQRQLAARVAPPDDKIRLLLVSLSERGGKLSRSALANRLSLPEVRMGGLLSAMRRLLNVDQMAVLTVDETAGTIELNIPLLKQQFGLTGQGGTR